MIRVTQKSTWCGSFQFKLCPQYREHERKGRRYGWQGYFQPLKSLNAGAFGFCSPGKKKPHKVLKRSQDGDTGRDVWEDVSHHDSPNGRWWGSELTHEQWVFLRRMLMRVLPKKELRGLGIFWCWCKRRKSWYNAVSGTRNAGDKTGVVLFFN